MCIDAMPLDEHAVGFGIPKQKNVHPDDNADVDGVWTETDHMTALKIESKAQISA